MKSLRFISTDLTLFTPLNGTGNGQLNVSNIGGILSQDLVWSASVETLPYAYIDSDAPGGPIFNWIDITGTGTPVTLDDDDDILITLPFTFPFYGEEKTSVRIGSNGYLTFGFAGSTFTNTNIPNTGIPNDIICPFWDDLDPTLGGTIHYLSTASQFIVQYTGIIHFGKIEPNTFQVILNADGSILFQYLDMQGNVNESTVGVEISDGMNGLQVVYNNAYIHNNLAVQIFSLPAVTWISSISPSSGTTAAGTSEQVTVSYDATGLTVGTYNGNILISSNAANIPSLIVPVTLTVQAPLLTSTINDVTVVSNNDGTPDEGSFSVDNTPANILFNSFIEQNASTDPLLKVYQTIVLTNVTVPFCNNCWATMEAFAGATGTAALVNTALPGTLVMSFRAWIDDNNDGVIDASEPAGDWVVYTITVNPELSTSISAVVFGTNSVVLKEKSKIISGDVVVEDVGSGVELILEEKVTTPSGYSLKANRIYVDKKAKIYSDVFYNDLTNKGSIYGSLNTPLDLPVYSSLPPFNEAPAGTEDKTVLKNQTLTLAPGDYRDIKVKEKGTLIFSGGIYNLRKLDAKEEAKLLFNAASEVRIEEKFSAGEKSVVGPKNGSGISASDIVFYVKGTDPNAAKFGEKNKTKANFYVPNGTLLIKEKSNTTGSFLARDVVIGENVKVTMESAFNNSLNKISSQQEEEEELVFNTIPEKYELMQNYPNPFNPSTVIMFALPEDAAVTLVVYDILGSKVAELVSGDIAAGIHEVAFDAANITSGIYFYRLTAGSYTQINKMILLK